MRIVIKVGTSTLTHKSGRLNIRCTENLCKIISDLKNLDNEVILVSSGAIGMGVGKLNLTKKPSDIPTKQAAAAVGQCELMYAYDRMFSGYSHTIAQILITKDDFSHEDRHQNFINTLEKLLEFNVLPIINENDTIATSEIKVGDNDTLSSYVAKSVHADILIIMSDIDGLYTANPSTHKDATLISEVTSLTDDIIALGEGAGSELGTGGMKTKLDAAKICMEANCEMVIINGKNPSLLYDVLEGKQVGTRFKVNK